MINEEIDIYVDTVVTSLIGNIFDLSTSKEEIFEAATPLPTRSRTGKLFHGRFGKTSYGIHVFNNCRVVSLWTSKIRFKQERG